MSVQWLITITGVLLIALVAFTIPYTLARIGRFFSRFDPPTVEQQLLAELHDRMDDLEAEVRGLARSVDDRRRRRETKVGLYHPPPPD